MQEGFLEVQRTELKEHSETRGGYKGKKNFKGRGNFWKTARKRYFCKHAGSVSAGYLSNVQNYNCIQKNK